MFRFFHTGESLVQLFFVNFLFFLYPPAVKNKNGREGKNFIVSELRRKMARLWIPYSICLTVTFIVNIFFTLPDRGGGWKEYICNLFFINGYIGVDYLDRAHWYMTTLISLTVACTILKSYRLANKPESYFRWMVLVVGLKAFDLDSLGHLVGGQYIGIACIGFSFAALMHSGKMIGTDLWHLKWYCVLTAAIVCTLRYFGVLRIVFVLVGIALLWNCLSEKLTILCTKPLQFLGTISYVLYLIHQNIAYTIEY